MDYTIGTKVVAADDNPVDPEDLVGVVVEPSPEELTEGQESGCGFEEGGYVFVEWTPEWREWAVEEDIQPLAV